jgi:hypothetical protein
MTLAYAARIIAGLRRGDHTYRAPGETSTMSAPTHAADNTESNCVK